MRLNCELEVSYSLAVVSGGSSGKSSRSRASICLGKKPVPPTAGSTEGESKKEELFLIVSTAKNVAGNKYKVSLKSFIPSLCKCACYFGCTISFRSTFKQLCICVLCVYV